MKIALVSPYDFAYPGGVCNHISSLEHHLTKMGHQVKVIAPASKAVPDFGDRFIPLGRPRSVPSSGSIARITISIRLSSPIKAMLAKEKFDIIHLHEPFCPMLCTGVLRFSDTANVGTFHASRAKGYTYWAPYTFIWLKKRFHKLHGRIAVSQPAMECADKHFHGDYTIIPNGVDLTRFSPDVAPIDEFHDGKVNLLFVGRLEKRKGLANLLEAYRQAKTEIPNSRLIIVGPGTRLRHKYEKWVAKNGLKDIIFTGLVSYEELPRYYKTADIVCAPATGRESFGIVLLEAMAVGKPIVASNIEGYASVVTHGTEGLLVPPKDGKKLVQTLVSLMTNEPLRQQMGAKGMLKASDYSWENIAKRVLNYYMKVLSEPPWKELHPEL
ncbi:glycosyltransferase family 4 protein [Chloroflexota bacterium]